MNCTQVVSKVILLFVFVLLWAASGCLIFIGAYSLHISGTVENVAKSTYVFAPAMIVIGVGIFLFALGLIGCFACVLESKCLLATFFSIMLVVLLGEVTASILGIHYRADLRSSIYTQLEKEMKLYGKDHALTKELDYIQSNYQCCGVNNATDWEKMPYYQEHNDTLPASCCPGGKCTAEVFSLDSADFAASIHSTNQPQTTTLPPGTPYASGCLVKLEEQLKDNLGYLAGFGLGFAFFQVLGLVATCIILCRSREVPYEELGHGGMGGLRV